MLYLFGMPTTSKKPYFSIITPVLHEAETITRHIAHVKGLCSAERCELIVVDGDPYQSTIKAIHDSTVITDVTEAGRARQMNAGAERGQGEMLVFLHADTAIPLNALEKISAAMENDRYVGGAFDLGIKSDRLALKLIARVASLRSRLTRIPYGDQAIFIRRDYFRNIGGFADIPIMEDVELMRRIKQRGEKIVIIPARALSSPRRWQEEGVVYCTIRNWILVTLYYLGVPPERLTRYYRFGRKTTRTGERA